MDQCSLVQVNNSGGYPNIKTNRRHENSMWSARRRDRDQGLVEAGDILLVYCTADVAIGPMALASEVEVLNISQTKQSSN